MKKIKIAIAIIFVALFVIPFNKKITYFKDSKGQIRLTRIDRGSVFIGFGTYFTRGYFSNRLIVPQNYVRPNNDGGGGFDLGCFELTIEFSGDSVFVYPAASYVTNNVDEKFRVEELPNAFGEKSWLTISRDHSSRYFEIDCNTFGTVD